MKQKINLRGIGAALIVLALLYVAWENAGGGGVALVLTGLVTYALVYISRMIKVLRRAATRPKGYVANAVMFNVKLKRGMNLLRVIALTDSIGDALSPPDAQPELFRWGDEGGSHVTCEFAEGRLAKWTLARPESPDSSGSAQETLPAATP